MGSAAARINSGSGRDYSELCTLGTTMGMGLQSQGGEVQGTEMAPNPPSPPGGHRGSTAGSLGAEASRGGFAVSSPGSVHRGSARL